MAITAREVEQELRNLEHDYRDAMQYHASHGDHFEMQRCERAYRECLEKIQRKYCMDNDMMNNVLAGQQFGMGMANQIGLTNNSSGIAMNRMLQNVAQQQVIKPAEAEEGVLMFRGAPLPDVWMGAHYDTIVRVAVGKQWKISFSSKYSSDTIMLWLSADEFSGNDADKVALTYRETINQRRIG